MIDHTNGKILRQLAALRRENRRRYAFHRMLEATDRALWRLEEMNRDGVKSVPRRVRVEIRELGASMPPRIGEALRDTGQVQDTLDSVFDVQERLFRWRYPDWHDFDPEEESFGVVAS
jgi:hypothetical protein